MVAGFFMVEAGLRIRNRPMTHSLYNRLRAPLILYMTITTSIYWLFLHKLVSFSSPFAVVANIFQHSGCLAFLLLDLIVDRPQTRLHWRTITVWLIFPIFYGVAIMIQGALLHWYPYPFIDIEKLGLQDWLVWNLGILINFGLIGAGVICLNNAVLRPKHSADT